MGGAVLVVVMGGWVVEAIVFVFVAILGIVIFVMIGGEAVVVAGLTCAPGWEWPPGC
jgi:hypothetical protein